METFSDSRLNSVQANCFAAMPSLAIVKHCANLTGESMCMAGVFLDSASSGDSGDPFLDPSIVQMDDSIKRPSICPFADPSSEPLVDPSMLRSFVPSAGPFSRPSDEPSESPSLVPTV